MHFSNFVSIELTCNLLDRRNNRTSTNMYECILGLFPYDKKYNHQHYTKYMTMAKSTNIYECIQHHVQYRKNNNKEKHYIK